MTNPTVPVATRLKAEEHKQVKLLAKALQRRSPADLYAQWIREGLERAEANPDAYRPAS